MSDELSRREMLKLAGATAPIVALSGCSDSDADPIPTQGYGTGGYGAGGYGGSDD